MRSHVVVLFMGAAMSITAFPVLVRILADQGLTRTPDRRARGDLRGVQRRGGVADPGGDHDDRPGRQRGATPAWTLVRAGCLPRRDVRRRAPAGRAVRAAGPASRSADRPVSLAIIGVGHRRVGLHDRTRWASMRCSARFWPASSCRVMRRPNASSASSVEPAAVTYLLPIFFAFSGLRTSVTLIAGPGAVGADRADPGRRHRRQGRRIRARARARWARRGPMRRCWAC